VTDGLLTKYFWSTSSTTEVIVKIHKV